MNKKILISILIISLFTVSAVLATAEDEITNITPVDNTPTTNNFDFSSVFKTIYGPNGEVYPQNLSGIILYPKMENGQLVPNMLAHYRINYQEGTYEIIDSFPGNYTLPGTPAAGSDAIPTNDNSTTNSTNQTTNSTNQTNPTVHPPAHPPEKQPINDTKNNEMKKTGGPIVAALIVGTLLSIVGLRRRD